MSFPCRDQVTVNMKKKNSRKGHQDPQRQHENKNCSVRRNNVENGTLAPIGKVAKESCGKESPEKLMRDIRQRILRRVDHCCQSETLQDDDQHELEGVEGPKSKACTMGAEHKEHVNANTNVVYTNSPRQNHVERLANNVPFVGET